MKKRKHLIIIFIAAAAMIFAIYQQISLSAQNNAAKQAPAQTASTVTTDSNSSDSLPTLYGPYTVMRIVDGDTIVVDIDGEDTKVRFIGVDTPESVSPDESKNTQEGIEASEWTKELLSDVSVYLEYDVSQYDKYNRTLAYVYLDDGVTMVQRLLLENGIAQIMTIQPNSKYADEFYQLQVSARESQIGFWGTEVFGD